MNRKMRRAALKRGEGVPAIAAAFGLSSLAPDELLEIASRHYRDGRPGEAQKLCRQIFEIHPGYAPSVNLLGVIAYEAGRYDMAVKFLNRAIGLNGRDATYHFNIARAYQALGQWNSSSAHFTQAIACRLENPESVIKENPLIAASRRRITEAWPRRLTMEELFGPNGLVMVAEDPLLWSLMCSRPVYDLGLERVLTAIRFDLLRSAINEVDPPVSQRVLGFFCALAQQCFLNEYVFAAGQDEIVQARHLQGLLVEKVMTGADIPPVRLASLATYFPLHKLPKAQALLERTWPAAVTDLLVQQVSEPLEEERDRSAIPAVTSIDPISLEVQRQYEENPYPRWSQAVPATPGTLDEYFHQQFPSVSLTLPDTTALDILIAGCGTGAQSIETGQRFPDARVLAVDFSLSSLAFARRKTREAGLSNVEYAHGDILNLKALQRRFDVIEAVGVLHHLADPKAGWQVLLSLLRPGGLMLVGLYSELARRVVTAARAFAAERGFRPTAEDIRTCRQELILRDMVPGIGFADFFTVSGCRDLIFNIMEHRFTIPAIKALVDESDVAFVGFDVPSQVRRQFEQRFSDPAAAADLDRWHEFETANPRTFAAMYLFWVQRNADA